MRGDAREYEHTQKRQRYEEQIEITIVAFANTVADPGTMVVKPIDTVVTYAAMRGTWRTEYFTRETVLELDELSANKHLFGTRWRTICGRCARLNVMNTLHVCCLVAGGPRQDAGIAETGVKQHGQHEHNQEDSDNGNDGGDTTSQKYTVEHKEERRSGDNEKHGEVEDTHLAGHQKSTVEREPVPAGKNAPATNLRSRQWRLWRVRYHFGAACNSSVDREKANSQTEYSKWR